MKHHRSALPCPRYVLRKPLKSGWSYYFNVPTWARSAGCPIKNEPLGSDYDAAVRRAETVLLPAFDSWLSGGTSDQPKVPAVGTLDWIFAEYRADRRFTKLDPKTKRIHESGMHLVGSHVLKDGRRLGGVRLTAIDTAVVDALYERLLIVKESDTVGRARAPHAGQSCDEDLSAGVEHRLAAEPAQGPDAQSVREDGSGVLQARDTYCDLRRTCGLPRQGTRNGLRLVSDRRPHRMGMAAARGSDLQHLRRHALPREGPSQRRPNPAPQDRRGSLVPAVRRRR